MRRNKDAEGNAQKSDPNADRNGQNHADEEGGEQRKEARQERRPGRTLFVGKGAVVEAKYSSPELPKYKGNPLIEALPRILSRQQITKALQRSPKVPRNIDSIPPHRRKHMAMDIYHFFQPLSVHLRLEGMTSRTLRDGYLARNPLDPSYSGTLRERLEFFKNRKAGESRFEPTAAGFFIIGMSGVGKSTGMSAALSLTPQVIVHSCYRGRPFTRLQVAWLRLECPQDGGSPAGLLYDFFQQMDDILGTNYTSTYGLRGRNVDELLLFMAVVAANHSLGLLVVDEIQNLSKTKGGGASQIINFLVKLINTLNLPVILIGTYKAVNVLNNEFRLARRGSGQGDLVWDRMPFDDEWRLYAEALWEIQYVMNRTPVTDSLSEVLHGLSYGIPDIANKVFMAAQWRAIDTGVETVTEDLLRSVYRDEFRLVNQILEVLKSGNIATLYNVQDVCPPQVMPIMEGSTDEPPACGTQASKTNGNQTARATDAKEQHSAGVHPTPSSASGPPSRPPVTTNSPSFGEEDLRGIVQQGLDAPPPVDQYHSLLEAGYIKSGSEFLFDQ